MSLLNQWTFFVPKGLNNTCQQLYGANIQLQPPYNTVCDLSNMLLANYQRPYNSANAFPAGTYTFIVYEEEGRPNLYYGLDLGSMGIFESMIPCLFAANPGNPQAPFITQGSYPINMTVCPVALQQNFVQLWTIRQETLYGANTPVRCEPLNPSAKKRSFTQQDLRTRYAALLPKN